MLRLTTLPARSLIVLCALTGLALQPHESAAQSDAEKARQLTDVQLAQELNQTETRLAQLGVSAQYLQNTRPAQTYTVYGQQFSSGTFMRQGNTGVFSFQGRSVYQIIPNYGIERLGHQIAALIVNRRTQSALRYRAALINEMLTRIAAQEAAAANRPSVQTFYDVYADLRGHEALVGAITPWVQRESPGMSESELLGAIAQRARAAVRARRQSASGDWYGVIVQHMSYADSTQNDFWMYVRLRLVQSAQGIMGVGELFDGEELVFMAQATGSQFEGQVLNATWGAQFTVRGELTADGMMADFKTELEGTVAVGRAILVR